ncbi:helix-turn-helix domain-containing protein [Chitinivorax sp. B]|uniref:helix-turn-helix domain-containing protein n=1 Tax=Chitinivorax sp. B TaxID=2502235 RepID=UPI0010F47816|nr:helix-turn-helix domain-containing protein [Chitinivorax sp. B]
MTSSEQRQTILEWLAQAHQQGARQSEVCRLLGLSDRTLQRWREPQRNEGDRQVRALRRHNIPPNKLSETERQAALATLHSSPYQDLPPSQVVPRLADEGIYLASESTMLRLPRVQRFTLDFLDFHPANPTTMVFFTVSKQKAMWWHVLGLTRSI